MIEDQLFEGGTCGKIPLEDLLEYVELTADSERDVDITSFVSYLSDEGYGKSLKEIDLFFQEHLSGCFTCNEYYQDQLAFLRKLYSPEGFREIMERVVVEKGDGSLVKPIFQEGLIGVEREYNELSRRFSLEHMDMVEEANELRSYVRDKVEFDSKGATFTDKLGVEHKVDFRLNPLYEDHLNGCDYCQKFQGIYKQVFDSGPDFVEVDE